MPKDKVKTSKIGLVEDWETSSDYLDIPEKAEKLDFSWLKKASNALNRGVRPSKKNKKEEKSPYIKKNDIKVGSIYLLHDTLIYIKETFPGSSPYDGYQISYQKLGKNLTPTKRILYTVFYDDIYSKLMPAVVKEKKKVKLRNLI